MKTEKAIQHAVNADISKPKEFKSLMSDIYTSAKNKKGSDLKFFSVEKLEEWQRSGVEKRKEILKEYMSYLTNNEIG